MHQTAVDFQLDSSGECPFLLLPLTFYHVLDERSPLRSLTAENLPKQDLELLVTLNGTMESTAASCQSRTSYLPQEILWSCEFTPVLTHTASGRLTTDFSCFDKVQTYSELQMIHSNTEKLQLEEEYRREWRDQTGVKNVLETSLNHSGRARSGNVERWNTAEWNSI